MVVAAAVATVLQRVSGSEYPPSLSDTTKLADRLSNGTLVGGFTGGGCTVQPVVHSKGRFLLVVPQKNQGGVREVLHKNGGVGDRTRGRRQRRRSSSEMHCGDDGDFEEEEEEVKSEDDGLHRHKDPHVFVVKGLVGDRLDDDEDEGRTAASVYG